MAAKGGMLADEGLLLLGATYTLPTEHGNNDKNGLKKQFAYWHSLHSMCPLS